jgi:predicted nuclease of predicted toxin-antitoxin system
VRFLIDAQLPPRLARRLADLGHDASHVADLGLASANDAQIWNTAVERRAILVTKDQDFAMARTAAGEGPAVIWVRLGNTDNETLIARFVQALDAMQAAVERGDAVVELVSRQA